ncbi:MAG: glycosyltransferase [Timaviella obliquedivisa GSE-PSE-MK23-08B]|jgi:glycosyltransferase involved in cell wall biosynthesis|nr:glycosyltransferase [Timaviella obliquedivisa GSE-PSE-MK23-08B]
MALKIAYLINQYPKVSHSFIRREILALEACGLTILRFAVRSCADELVDEADQQELKKTRFLLEGGAIALLQGLLAVMLRRPSRFLQAIRLTLKLGWRSEQGVLKHLAYLAEACVLLNWVAEAEVTHVHAHFGTNPATVAMLCRLLGGPPFSFTVHGPEEFDKVEAIALPQKIEHAAFVVAISSFGRSQLYRWTRPEQWSKIRVVHCGVDANFLAIAPTPIPNQPRFVCVGRLSEQKGQLLLIEAAKRLAEEGLSFELVLVGDGELRSSIETLITGYQLQDHIKITGWATTSEVREHLLNAKVMVLPSFAEGLPVVLMEALALCRPVISTYIAGIPELVENNTCGWLITPGSIEALVSAMRSALLTSQDQLKAMGQAGLDRVALNHNIELEASKLAIIFRMSIEHLQSESACTASLLPSVKL